VGNEPFGLFDEVGESVDLAIHDVSGKLDLLVRTASEPGLGAGLGEVRESLRVSLDLPQGIEQVVTLGDQAALEL
jgi:hypothetical protein